MDCQQSPKDRSVPASLYPAPWYHFCMTQFDDTRTDGNVLGLHLREEERVTALLAPTYGYPYVNLQEVHTDAEALRLLPEADAKRGELAVFARNDTQVSVAIRNPKNPEVPILLEQLKNEGFIPTTHLASMQSILTAWEHYHDIELAVAEVRGVLGIKESMIEQFKNEIHSPLDVGSLLTRAQENSNVERITKIIEVIFGGAFALKASDIHIEPDVRSTRIRYRLDGILVDIGTTEREVTPLIISRLKLLSGLKLNTHADSQDGRFTFDIVSRKIEIRTSVIPGALGESIAMRLLDPRSENFNIEKLGLSARMHEVIIKELSRPNGSIITTGPTGSGKTTALYSFLQAVHKPELKIITLEDPVEYKLPGIVQIQVNKEYTFATGLRSILRQDPDVILVGEIRDREVAETVVHAALTGHLVFSTLHTNSAAAAFARLTDIGVDSRMFGSAFNIILGQRLVRVLCEKCKVERSITTEEQTMIQRILETPVAIHSIFDAKGCEACGMSGYKGRVGVFEAILVDEAVENVVLSDTRESVILEAAKPQNIPSMQQDGLFKVLGGVTSLDELSRVLGLYI